KQNNHTSKSKHTINPETITYDSGFNTTAGTRPRIYYKKSSDSNDTSGWKFVEASGAGGSPFSLTIDYSLLNAGSVVVGDTVQYFVVAQDTATPVNVGINSGTFAATPASVALTATAFPIGGSIYSYQLQGSISGTFDVGTGRTYTTITAAVTDLNSTVIVGPVTFLLYDASNTTSPENSA